MDDIKKFAKYYKELGTLIQTMIISSLDTGKEFDIENMLRIKKSRKRQILEGIEIPNQKRIKTFKENENHNYLGYLEANTIKQTRNMKRVPQTNEKTAKNQALQ